MSRDYYALLEVAPSAEFDALRKAYRHRVMQCHPDRLGGDRSREAEFKAPVDAFDVLSDPLKRADYDRSRGQGTAGRAEFAGAMPSVEVEGAILDSFADDILEELIVGNTIPRGTTLQTLMMDLERTQRFCLFREAKTCFYGGRRRQAERLFRRYLGLAPRNLLAHHFLAQCMIARGQWKEAEAVLAAAIRIGEAREPKQRLRRMREELERVRTQRPGLLTRIRLAFVPKMTAAEDLDTEEQERKRLNRALNRMAAKRPIRWSS